MDLSTRYLGMTLRNPLVASASPLNNRLDNLRHLEDLGAGAVVLPSIFEEQIEREQELVDALTEVGADTYGEALTYFPSLAAYSVSTDHYLALISSAREALGIPVIASLNGVTDHGWISYARQIEEAGANALELNIYFLPSGLEASGSEVEARYMEIVEAVRQTVSIPVSVKLSPYFSAPGHMAQQLCEAGADGLVLFNRFYQPDIDLSRLTMTSDLELSTPYEMRLPLLWIGVLSGNTEASLAASSGVDGVEEVIKYLLAGADVVMTTSALLRHGLVHMKVLVDQLAEWLDARDIASPDEIRGRMSHRNVADPEAFERANYIRVLQGYSAP